MASELRKIGVSDDCEIAVRLDDYLLPSDNKPPVLMLHGLAESGEAFRRWVPYFATHHLVVRPDLRGYGDSTPMQGDYVYRFAGLGDDILRVLDVLKLDHVFLVGDKIGGTLAMHLAANHPDRVIALAAIGAQASLTSFSKQAATWRNQIREQGVEAWVRETSASQFGSSLAPPAVDWWIRLMSKTKASTLEAFLKMVPTVDVTGELPAIARPTLIITTTALVDSVKNWQQTIPNSKLESLPGDCHLVATNPDVCARMVRAFFDRIKT